MKIEELIDRYFEGQTSCDEERELRRFFTQENIPALTAPIPADMARLAPELLTETECASEEI